MKLCLKMISIIVIVLLLYCDCSKYSNKPSITNNLIETETNQLNVDNIFKTTNKSIKSAAKMKFRLQNQLINENKKELSSKSPTINSKTLADKGKGLSKDNIIKTSQAKENLRTNTDTSTITETNTETNSDTYSISKTNSISKYIKGKKKPKKLVFNFSVVKTRGLCTLDNCEYDYGICIGKNVCQCNPGFADVKENHNLDFPKYCTYEQNYQSSAFFLELFFGFGIGHFYAKRVSNGIFKMLTFLLILPSILIFFAFVKPYLELRNSNAGI